MQDQLVKFLCDHWSANDRRRRQMKFQTRSKAEEYFEAQAARLTTGSIQLRAVVLDATVTRIRARGARTSARRQQIRNGTDRDKRQMHGSHRKN